MGPYHGRWKGIKGHGDTILPRNSHRSCRTRLDPAKAQGYQRASRQEAAWLPACTCAPLHTHSQVFSTSLTCCDVAKGAYVRTPCCLHFSATRTVSQTSLSPSNNSQHQEFCYHNTKGKSQRSGFPMESKVREHVGGTMEELSG